MTLDCAGLFKANLICTITCAGFCCQMEARSPVLLPVNHQASAQDPCLDTPLLITQSIAAHRLYDHTVPQGTPQYLHHQLAVILPVRFKVITVNALLLLLEAPALLPAHTLWAGPRLVIPPSHSCMLIMEQRCSCVRSSLQQQPQLPEGLRQLHLLVPQR